MLTELALIAMVIKVYLLINVRKRLFPSFYLFAIKIYTRDGRKRKNTHEEKISLFVLRHSLFSFCVLNGDRVRSRFKFIGSGIYVLK